MMYTLYSGGLSLIVFAIGDADVIVDCGLVAHSLFCSESTT